MSVQFPIDGYPSLRRALKERQEKLETLLSHCTIEELQRLDGVADHNPDMLELELMGAWRKIEKRRDE
ncbi:MAG: hypothetical protein HYS26_03570 [Candidatus Kaiserbacteria bacterium]|nr:MAG: hypothetical protein HYS26_03570 [Candidatus Kaiserbacteria bacterium]